MRSVNEYATPQLTEPAETGLAFPADGSGLQFDAGYPLAFPPDPVLDLRGLFPSYVPQPEKIVYEAVKDACSTRATFPPDGQGIPLPVQFNLPPDVSLYAGLDPSYPLPSGKPGKITPIPVVRGWPAFPGKGTPAIGVAEGPSPDDESERLAQSGFAGDVFARDDQGNVLATAAYYAEPMSVTVIVELIHTNRDERDRLHDQLRRVILPLRSRIPGASSQVRDVHISAEKQDLPIDEQPTVMYVSLFTITVSAEALIATEIVPGGVITEIRSTPDVQTIEIEIDGNPNLT